MSGYPSHDGPRQYNHNYLDGSFANWGQHASNQGTIVNSQTTNYWQTPDGLLPLRAHCSPSAGFDAAARFDPPRCTESTRLGIIQKIEAWVNSNDPRPLIFWLYGGAGVGKSAIAQTVAEKLRLNLAASFFFFRPDPSRNSGDNFFLTLVLHMANSIRELRYSIEDQIAKDPGIFTKNHETQVQELLVFPFSMFHDLMFTCGPIHPRLVVIDGLDECKNPDVQCKLLSTIAQAIPRIPYPLRFLITSRPESHIRDTFDYDSNILALKISRHNLSHDPDADSDILVYFRREFNEIRRTHPLSRLLPTHWPRDDVINKLVEKSSGHFIYASTVIKYTQSRKHRPDDRLRVILRILPPHQQDRPYALLDALYSTIFQDVENPIQLEQICLMFGILHLHSQPHTGLFSQKGTRSCDNIEKLLEMKPGDLILLLDPILSLVAIDHSEVRTFHKSLFDYLLDPTRSGHLPFDLSKTHGMAANFILKHRIRTRKCITALEEFGQFAYHCRFGYLDGSLKDYLLALDAPYHKCIETTAMNGFFPSYETWKLMFSFFSTMSREDFDSSGHYHEQHTTKWINYLHSAIPPCHQLPRRFPSMASDQVANVSSLKARLDTLLKSWKPKNFNPPDMRRVDLTHVNNRVESIAREHTVFSTYATKTSGPADAVASSLVFGDYFIHSHHIRIQQEPITVDSTAPYLILRTYAVYDDVVYGQIVPECYDFPDTVWQYLREAEKLLFSDVYQKYGIIP